MRQGRFGYLLGMLLIAVASAVSARGPAQPKPSATHSREVPITLDLRPHTGSQSTGDVEVCYSEGEPEYVGTDPFAALVNLPPSQVVRPPTSTRSISVTVLTGDSNMEFELIVYKLASPIRMLGTFRSDSSGTRQVVWDMRDSLGARVRKGVYQVTAKRDYMYDNKYVVVEGAQ